MEENQRKTTYKEYGEVIMEHLQRERRKLGRSLSQLDALLSLKPRGKEKEQLLRQKRILLAELDDLKSKIGRPTENEIITDHALIRWLERKKGISIEKLRKIILTDALQIAINSGSRYWSDGEVIFIIDQGAIRTVIPVDQYEEAI